MEPALKNKKIRPGFTVCNDLINGESQDSVQNLLDNFKQIGLNCKLTGVARILISGIVVNNKLTSGYISSVNQRISNLYRDNSFVFIESNNIPRSYLFRDGLHFKLENI